VERVAEIYRPRLIDNDTFRRLNEARDFIAEHHDRILTLEDVAHEACFSPFHFQRQFKRAFQESPHEFMTRIRLEKAQELLRQSDLTVSEICLEVGYESLGSFSTLFARKAGCPPTDFRRIYSIPVHWWLRSVPGCFVSRSNFPRN
jgi:AraC-like DNA-binding protein